MPSTTKLTRALVDVAMGRIPADLVIQNGQWVSVQSGEIIPGSDVAIKDGHIAYVGEDASHTIGKKTKVIDAKGRYLVPGLLDGHMHVESGMVTVTEFVRAVAKQPELYFHGEFDSQKAPSGASPMACFFRFALRPAAPRPPKLL